MSGHTATPGPWTTCADGWHPWPGAIQILGPDGHIIAYTSSGTNEKADAPLLAAAPDLVKALEASADALREARAWVMKAPEDTWGHNSQGDYGVPGGVASWPMRDELSHNIGASEIAARAALATLIARKMG